MKMELIDEGLLNLIKVYEKLKIEQRQTNERISLLQDFFMKELTHKRRMEVGEYELKKMIVERPYLKVDEIRKLLGECADEYIHYAKQKYIKVSKKAA